MLFIISLIVAFLMVNLFTDSIKKHAVVWYVATIIVSVGMYMYSQLELSEYMPKIIDTYIMRIFSKSSLGTALFTVVMYAAILDKSKEFTKKIYRVRGEVSIIACILTLVHNVIYGQSIFVKLFTDPSSFETPKLVAAIVSIILIVLMLILTITSFKCIRKQMNSKTWKSIQRLAYIFYGLIYVHIMCLFVPKASKRVLEIVVYSIVFITYFVARSVKACKAKNKKA